MMFLLAYYFVVFSVHVVYSQCSPCERTPTVQIQNYDGPIYLNPASCGDRCERPCSKSCSIMYHIGNKGCEADCNCISKATPVNVVPQSPCCWQGTASCGTHATTHCGTPQYGTSCCVQAVPVCPQTTYLQPTAYYTVCPQTQTCGSHQSCCMH